MPYKDPKKRREAGRRYTEKYSLTKQAEGKPVGQCSVLGCQHITSGGKKCDHHLAYMREYKKKYRAQPKPPGTCNNSDCINPAREGFKLCEGCNERSKAKQKDRVVSGYRIQRDQTIQEEVLAAYEGKCLCCGETTIEFLSIDHIDGYDGKSPRKGGELYRWLKRNCHPPGFRVLCMSCNFALGHAGYCSHGDLVCEAVLAKARVRDPGNAYYRLKTEVFYAYGGYECVCCGDTAEERLQIDHIEENGPAHRKEITGNSQNGTTLYHWLRKNGFPSGYQVLCVNCNFAKGHFGHCPHQAS